MDTKNMRGKLIGKLLITAMAGALAGGTMACKKEEAQPAPAAEKKDDTAGAAKAAEPDKAEAAKAPAEGSCGAGSCSGNKAEGEKAAGEHACSGDKAAEGEKTEEAK